ncbi:GALDH dehydrogenase, partial [Acromyrmex heyeri]
MFPPTYVEGFHDPEAVKAMEYKELGETGMFVSKLAFGSATLCALYNLSNEAEAIETVRQAIKQGINYIDTAPWYGQGQSEAILGKALKGIPRKAYYISTKVGRYELDYDNMFNFTVEKTRQSFKKSLELLGLNYVDLIQIHDIDFAPTMDVIVTQTLPELSKYVADGKARHVGVTAYTLSALKECVEKSNVVATVLSYSRNTLVDDTLLEYIPFFKEHKIGLINAAALCMGLLTNNGPQSWHSASDETKKQCAKAAQYCKDRDVELSKLAIWHSMQCADVDTNLVGIQNMKELQINLDVTLNGITEKEKTVLKEIKEKFLSTKNHHWEGKDVRMYKEGLKKK